MRPLHILILSLLPAFISQAQTHTIHRYGVAEGLPSSEVYDILQDSKGFLWFSTDNGVARYDGYQFKNYSVADGLPTPVVFETQEDASGKIWFRTYSNKVATFENEQILPFKFNEQLAEVCGPNFVSSMTVDSLGQLWYSVGEKWGVVDSTGNILQYMTEPNNFAFQSVGKSGITSSMRERKGIAQILINGQPFPIQLTDPIDDPKTSHVVTRLLYWNNNLYLTINNNIFRYDGITITLVYRASRPIIAFSKDKRNNLWVGFFNGGAKRFESDAFIDPWTPDFLENKSVTCILEDHEGGIWITTLENGALYLPNHTIQHYSLGSTSKIKTVATRGDQILIGEYDGTLTSIHGPSKREMFRKKFPRTIHALYKDSKNRMWVSSESLDILSEQNVFTKKNKTSLYRDFTEDNQGQIWAIAHNGLSHFNQESNLVYTKMKKLTFRSILAIDSVFIMGLQTGVHIYDHDLSLLKISKKLESSKISDIIALSDSTLLVATTGNGFFITDKNLTWSIHHQRPASNIYSVLTIDSTIWFGTEKGVLKTSIKSLLKGPGSYDFITRQSGLLSDQVSILAKSGDEIFVFYNSDFSVIPLANKKYANQVPIFYAKGLTINSKPFAYSTQFDLLYDQNNIQLDFGFISFNHQDILTRYRLNSESDWNSITERSIDLYSLSPGNYALELQYSVDGVHWIKASNMPTIHISPPWWQTFTFQIAFILFISGVTYFFFKNRLVIYRQREEKMKLVSKQQKQLIRTEIETLERERSRIAKDLHDGVGTNILATKLSVSRLLRKYQDTERESVESQFQDTLQEIKDIIYNLAPPGLERYGLETGVRNHVDRISSSTSVTFTINSFGPELTDIDLTVPLFRILQELITNSLKHSNAKNISIHMNSFDDLYNIVYEDSGIGFSMEANHKGLGLHSIESRVKAIHGKIRFESGSFGISYSIDVPVKK